MAMKVQPPRKQAVLLPLKLLFTADLKEVGLAHQVYSEDKKPCMHLSLWFTDRDWWAVAFAASVMITDPDPWQFDPLGTTLWLSSFPWFSELPEH